MKNIKSWAVAVILLSLVLLFWSVLFIAMSPILIPVTIASLFKDEVHFLGVNFKFLSWRYNMFISQDQGANAMLGGDMDTHVSGRVGRRAIKGNDIALKMETVINLLFKALFKESNHCRNAIEHDEKYNKNWGG